MAQLVERTLGKGEVLSSILSISTIIKTPAERSSAGVLFYAPKRISLSYFAPANAFLRY